MFLFTPLFSPKCLGRTELNFTNANPGAPGDTPMCPGTFCQGNAPGSVFGVLWVNTGRLLPARESIVCKVSYSHIKRNTEVGPGALLTGRPSLSAAASQGPGSRHSWLPLSRDFMEELFKEKEV